MTARPPAASPRRRPLHAPRRAPVDWRRYAERARGARTRLAGPSRPLALSFGAWLVLAVAAVAFVAYFGTHAAARVSDLARSVAVTIPQATPGDIVLGETSVNVSAAPVLDPLPEFTRTTGVTVSGKVPPFAVRSDSSVRVALNRTIVTTSPISSDGRFGPMPLTLVDGTNSIVVSLVDGTTVVASASASVVVERTPPTLGIVRPKTGDVLEGPDVTVEGKTDPGASVIVNDHVLYPAADGTFTGRLVGVAPGPLAISVVATDRAGNETKAHVDVTVKPAASPATAGTILGLTLDRTTVRPGASVVAQIVATEGGKPKADLPVTLQVGVITIGTYRTDATGTVRVGFAAPDRPVASATVIALGGGATATAALTVAQ